jgi:hypothetical protein
MKKALMLSFITLLAACDSRVLEGTIEFEVTTLGVVSPQSKVAALGPLTGVVVTKNDDCRVLICTDVIKMEPHVIGGVGKTDAWHPIKCADAPRWRTHAAREKCVGTVLIEESLNHLGEVVERVPILSTLMIRACNS